jgi:hypothetical protein
MPGSSVDGWYAGVTSRTEYGGGYRMRLVPKQENSYGANEWPVISSTSATISSKIGARAATETS